MRIAVDLANGSACATAAETLDALGATVEAINSSPNGLNINKDCGSTHPEGLQEYVIENGCDVGFAFDGDADRLIAVDSDGRLINGDYILYILGRSMRDRGQLTDNMVVTTVMANLGLYKAFEREQISCIKTPVGDKYVFEEMSRNQYRLGGEQSGHIIFYGDEVTGDGLFTALKLLQVMQPERKNIQQLSEGLHIFPQLLENVTVTDKEIVLDDEEISARVQEVADELGSNGRILVRPSGTEPLIRVMVEAPTQEECERCVHAVTELIREKGYEQKV